MVSFSPMHHWTDHNIRVHLFTCVLALQLAHLMRRQTKQAGIDLSVRELLATLRDVLADWGEALVPGVALPVPLRATAVPELVLVW